MLTQPYNLGKRWEREREGGRGREREGEGGRGREREGGRGERECNCCHIGSELVTSHLEDGLHNVDGDKDVVEVLQHRLSDRVRGDT